MGLPPIIAPGGLGPNTELEDPPGLYEKVLTMAARPNLARPNVTKQGNMP